MSSEWRASTIGAICTKVFSGGTPTSTIPAYYGGSIPWLRTKEVNYTKIFDTETHISQLGFDNSSVKLVPKDSVIVAMYGNGDTAGRVAINKVPLTTNQACCNLVIDPTQADFRFVYYYLSGKYKELVDLKNGGAQQNLNGQLVKAFPFEAPGLDSQRGIADILEGLDDRITLLRETNVTLEAIAQALFKSWFVDFDPVRAKSEGRVPDGMDETTAALFADNFEMSAFGSTPAGWSVGYLYDLAVYINGAAYKAFNPNAERRGRPIIKIAELKAGVTPQTAYSDVDMPLKYLIATGDILFSWSGNPDTSIDTFVWTHDSAWLNQHIFRVIPHSAIERSFVLQLLRHFKPVFSELARNKQTTGLGHVTVADLKRMQFVKPSVEVITCFDSVMSPIHQRILANERQATTLLTLRDIVLPRLISGQLRLPELDTAMEELAA
jgi:type I restriction enzyme S subunit